MKINENPYTNFPKELCEMLAQKEVDFYRARKHLFKFRQVLSCSFSKFPHLSSTPFTNLVQTNFPRRQRFGRTIRQLDNQFPVSINGCRNAAEVLPVLGKSDVFANHKGALSVFF